MVTDTDSLPQVVNLPASASQGDALFFDGTDWVVLNAGTAGQFLKTLGAGANPAWDTLPVSGAWTLVEKITPSAASSVAFTSITSRKIFMLVFELEFSAAAQLNMSFNSDSGSNYEYNMLNGSVPNSNSGQAFIAIGNGRDADDRTSGKFIIGGIKATGDSLTMGGISGGQDVA